MNDINKLNLRIFELSIKHNLSHLGSCFTTLPILYEIFSNKNEHDKVVLSNGHSGLALYVILEHFYDIDADALLMKYGVHPERDIDNNIYVSAGSLGLGISIASGMAIGNKHSNIHCVISDGECAEGIVWETLSFVDEYDIKNLLVYVNINGWGAYRKIDIGKLIIKLKAFLPSIRIYKTNVNDVIQFETDLSAHYTQANSDMKLKTQKDTNG